MEWQTGILLHSSLRYLLRSDKVVIETGRAEMTSRRIAAEIIVVLGQPRAQSFAAISTKMGFRLMTGTVKGLYGKNARSLTVPT